MAKITQGPSLSEIPVDHPDVMDNLNTNSLKPARDAKRAQKTKGMSPAMGPDPDMHKHSQGEKK